MFGTEFHHQLIRKYVILFGSLFNQISISRYNDTKTKIQNFKVPIQYAPREKYLGIVDAKPNDKIQSVILPTMAFEITGMSYNAAAQLPRHNRHKSASQHTMFELTPYAINFQVNVMAKNNIDATRIVEQILPYFDPSYSITAELIDGISPFDITIDLSDVTHEDTYAGSFEERRLVTWTLNFTMYAFFAKPIRGGKQIKMVITNLYPNLEGGAHQRTVTQPGLTADGDPTTDLNQTIPYIDIDEIDDYGVIVTVTDEIE